MSTFKALMDGKRATFKCGTKGLHVRRRGLFRRERIYEYRDIQPEYTIHNANDNLHLRGVLIIILILLFGVAVGWAYVQRWPILEHITREHWYYIGGGILLMIAVALLLVARHRGPMISYRFAGKQPFSIGGPLAMKEDLDIFVNQLQQQIWSGGM